MARTIKSISFDDTDNKLLDHISKCPNFSTYVKALIRDDMERKRHGFSTEQLRTIKNLFNRMFEEYSGQIIPVSANIDMDDKINKLVNDAEAMAALEQFEF